jgi:hypothetical protein
MSRARTLATVLGADGSFGSADVTTALGYTPVNKAGDTMTGSLNVVGTILRSSVFFSGYVDVNLAAGQTGYWCISPITITNGFSLIIDVVAESWTVWNVCRIYLRKSYNNSTVTASITHQYAKSTVTVAVVTVRVDGIDYLAISRTGGDPAMTLNAMGLYIGDSAPFHTRSGTVQATHATY